MEHTLILAQAALKQLTHSFDMIRHIYGGRKCIGTTVAIPIV